MERDKIQKIIDSLSFSFPYTTEEWLENKYIENFHYHSCFSNSLIADSPTSNEEYAEHISKNGYKCLFSGEHGSQGNHIEVYIIAEKYGLKYRHSSEVYWVKNRLEKDSTNSHMCIVAITKEGRYRLNEILSVANEDGFYRRPRIDLELLFSLNKEDFIVTSACIAGWNYEDSSDVWIQVANHFGNHFFFELQSNDTQKQKDLNKKIIELSNKYKIDYICGLDSHYISEEDSIKRDKVLEYKKISYPEEYGWYMDFPDVDTIIKRFEKQGVLTEEQIFRSILNTNIFNSDICEEIILDKSFKIPSLYKDKTYEEKVKIFKDLINEQYKKEPIKSKERVEGIKYEVEQIVDSGVVDYFLTNYRGFKNAIEEEGGVITTTSRGSMASFYVNKLLEFTTIDRFNAEVPIYPERFLTKERVLAGQMPDCDINLSKQEPFVESFRKLLGKHSCYPLMAVGKMKEKASWQLYASVSGIEPSVADEISKFIEKYDEALKYADEEDKEFIKIEDFIPKEFLETYKGSLKYQGIVSGLKVHACGHLIFDGDIRREIGLISAISKTTKKRTLVACVEGTYLDDFGYVKDDFLIVDCVTLIDKFWKSIGQRVPTFDELRELIKEDKPTWEIYEKGITCCINQVERESTTKKAMEYKPKNLGEISTFISAIRPGFKTLLPTFIKREEYTTGEKKIDELLEDSQHFMSFQESIMKVLSFLGLEMSETYVVIKNISKKKYIKHPEKLKLLKDELKQNWLNIFGNTDNFDNVWNVIESSAFYGFNSPHALSMGGDSTYGSYFKAHYTSNFYEEAINHYQTKDNKDKINLLLAEANKFYGYKMGGIRFGKDNRKVIVDDENMIIYQNMRSVKDMQKQAPDILYEIGKTKYSNFMNVLGEIKKSNINKKSLDILIKLDYFSEFGDPHKLLEQVKIYDELSTIHNKFKTCSVFKKDYADQLNIPLDEIKSCAEKETDKQFSKLDNDKLIKVFTKHYPRLLEEITAKYPYKPTTIVDRIRYEVELLGYTNLIDESIDVDYYMVLNVDTNKWGTHFITTYQLCSGVQNTYKTQKDKKTKKTWYDLYPCKKGDIIYCAFVDNQKGRYETIDGVKKWINLDEYETLIQKYSIK